MILSFHESENQGQKLPISLRLLGADHQQEPIFRPSYFGAVFRREVGVTPERYRSGK